ncbi:MAG: hypothetical protein LKJ31_00035 [Atopobiaceae bacterium]|nr:hypothetical protein [Atopobiaceae bacterium]
MGIGQLVCVIAAIPLLAILIERLDDADISERHHSHHDTYLVPQQLCIALALMMVFVGIFGLVLGWLCYIGVFLVDTMILDAFFAVFLTVVFALWLGIKRYRIVTFGDRLSITPFFGPKRTIRYVDIDCLRWRHALLSPSYQNLRLYAYGRSVFLWGVVDLEQILACIDRYDILERHSAHKR